jgi:hypothetical protein
MSEQCNRLDLCGFFKKWQTTKDLACSGFINMYCKGDGMNACKRKEYFLKYGMPPSDDMMPNGFMVAQQR